MFANLYRTLLNYVICLQIPGQDSIYGEDADFPITNSIKNGCLRLFRSIRLNPDKFPPRPPRIYFEFSRNYEHLQVF